MFGRFEGLVVPTLQPILSTSSDAKIAIETVGGEEYSLMLEYLDSIDVDGYKTANINCRSHQEKAGIDLRILLPNALKYDVWGDSHGARLRLILRSINFPY